MKPLRLSIFTTLLMVLLSCATNPITGRKQLALIPSSTLNSMAFSQYSSFLQEHKISNDPVQTAMVRRVGTNIKNAVERYYRQQGLSSKLEGYSWEFNLVEDDLVNAWAMPGGKVVVYTGLLPVAVDEAGLAVVMGHEVAHAIAGHGNERMTQGLLTQLGGVALSEALKNKPDATRNLFLGAYGLGATVGVMLPFSRTHESEADHMGLIFMAMGGYDPNVAVDFWERMSANNKGGAPPEFLSTHPSDRTRIRQIKELIPKAMKYYSPKKRKKR